MGQDHHGNKYYENKDYPHGEDRKRGESGEAFILKPYFKFCIEFSLWMPIVSVAKQAYKNPVLK